MLRKGVFIRCFKLQASEFRQQHVKTSEHVFCTIFADSRGTVLILTMLMVGID